MCMCKSLCVHVFERLLFKFHVSKGSKVGWTTCTFDADGGSRSGNKDDVAASAQGAFDRWVPISSKISPTKDRGVLGDGTHIFTVVFWPTIFMDFM